MANRYWLFKSDPDTFSFDDLQKSPKRTTCWDGVRNYQARNYLGQVRIGDRVLFYHSQSEKAVVGTARVVKGPHPDPTQFDRRHAGYDPDSDPAEPRWLAVDIAFERKLPRAVGLDEMRRTKGLSRMVLLRRGTRLSVQPVTAAEWKTILRLGGA